MTRGRKVYTLHILWECTTGDLPTLGKWWVTGLSLPEKGAKDE